MPDITGVAPDQQDDVEVLMRLGESQEIPPGSSVLPAVRQIGQRDRAIMGLEAELRFASAHLLLMRLNHAEPDEHTFTRPDTYWIDLCLTPRRPSARARYVDHWGPHRFGAMGSLMALPPRFNLQLRNEGGRHLSVICALNAEAVERWLPSDFEWTDRRLEACLDISSPTLHEIMHRLAKELRRPGIASAQLYKALLTELGIEFARYLVAMAEPTGKGGLAMWRLRLIEKRLTDQGELPTLGELATLCNISPRQLTRGFRTSRGCSIGDYMAQSRIENAKRRLAGTETLKAVATSAGFASQSNFTRAFRRATGFTPLQFRRRLAQRLLPTGDEG